MCAWSCRGCVCGPRDDDAEEEDGALEAGGVGVQFLALERAFEDAVEVAQGGEDEVGVRGLEGEGGEEMKARLAHAVVVRVGIVEVRGEGGA